MPQEATATAKDTRTPESLGWQLKLLPLMIAMLASLTLVFTLVNIWEAHSIQKNIENTRELDMSRILEEISGTASPHVVSFAERTGYMEWEVRAILEGDAINRRYHQASTVSLTRTYIVFIGFTTGMILALVGAAFILGKLHESSSTVAVGVEHVKMSLVSSSPGLVLAAMGTTLMLTTVFIRSEVQVTDGPLYLTTSSTAASDQINAATQNDPVATVTRRGAVGQSDDYSYKVGSTSKVWKDWTDFLSQRYPPTKDSSQPARKGTKPDSPKVKGTVIPP